MKQKEEAITEVEVLTPEQLEALPQEVKENVVFLTESSNFSTGNLAKFNPLVSELLKLKAEGAALKLKPADEDGKFDKANVQEFIDLNKKVGSYNSNVKESAKFLKEPFTKIHKGLVAIEKAFLSEASSVKEAAELELKPYRDEEKRKKDERERKKNEAILKAAEDAKKEAAESVSKLEISAVYNKVKYEIINKKLSEEVSENLLNSNLEKVTKDLETIKSLTYVDIVGAEDDMLDEETKDELLTYFTKSKETATNLLKSKVDEFQLKRDKEIQEAIDAKKDSGPIVSNAPVNISDVRQAAHEVEKHIPGDIPLPPNPTPEFYKEPDFADLNDDEFIDRILKHGEDLLSMVELRLAKHPSPNVKIYQIKTVLSDLKKI